MNGIIPEMEQIISQLERGTVVTKFFPRKRPEKKTLMIRRETRQIVWSRSTTFRPFDGSGKILPTSTNLCFNPIYLIVFIGIYNFFYLNLYRYIYNRN